VRDKDGREVDFAIIKNKKPIELIAAKWSETQASRHLIYYAEKLKISKARQIINRKGYRHVRGALEVLDSREALSNLRFYCDLGILWGGIDDPFV